MSDLDWSPIVATRLKRFRDNPDGVRAIAAIRVIVRAGMSIPDDLVPWLDEACDAWEKTKGNKVKVKADATPRKREEIVRAVHSRRMAGETVVAAIRTVAGEVFLGESTVLRYYKKPEYRHFRDAVENELRQLHVYHVESGDADQAAALAARFPNLTGV